MKKIILAVIVLVQFGSNSFAQENMPYSRYGIGTLQPSQFQSTMGMGNCATTFQNEFMQNPANPASYAALASKAVTFEAAIQGRQNILNIASSSSKYFDMNPAHVGLAAMVHSSEKFKWGMGFNLLPYSKVSYNVVEEGNKLVTPTLLKQKFQGSGNIYVAQFSNGIKYKNLSLGVNVGYMFGGIRSNVIAYYPDTAYALATVFDKNQRSSGMHIQLGMQYVVKIAKDQKLLFGATFTPQTKLQSTFSQSWIRINNSGIGVDTAYSPSDIKGKVILPSEFAIGVQWSQGRNWGLATEFTQSLWSNYKNMEAIDSFKNASKVAVGAFFTPDPTSTQIFRRTIYRVGFNYGTNPLTLRGKQFTAYSFTAGVSMPVLYKAEEGRPMYMFVHANIESGVKTNNVSTLINENFVRFNLGVTISGNWFQKRKFD
jgi:hypothetical protein